MLVPVQTTWCYISKDSKVIHYHEESQISY